MTVKAPGGIFSFLAALSFTFSSLFSDILVIRVSLLFAYVFLLVTGALGNPLWPGVEGDGNISLETCVFAAINVVTHSIAIARLLYDERPIRFHGEDEERLWRFLYRRGGFEPLEARQVIDRGTFRRVPGGGVVLTEEDSSDKLCILVDGKAAFCRRQIVVGHDGNGYSSADPGTGSASRAENVLDSQEDVQGVLLSGSIFDMRLTSIFGVYTGFEGVQTNTVKTFSATATKDCLVFDIPFENLDELASRCGPAVSSYFRNLLLCDVALQLEYRVDGHSVCSTGVPEDDTWREGAPSRDFSDPLEDAASSLRSKISSFLRLFVDSFSWLVPSGTRHVGLRGLPRTGLAARRRLRAKQQARERASLVAVERAQRGDGLLQRLSSRWQRAACA